MLAAFQDRLSACLSLDAVGAVFQDAVRAHGFGVCAGGAFVPTDTGPEPHFFFQSWPPDWLELYTSRNFVAVDFSVAEARRRLSPFTWVEARAERVLSRAEEELWDMARLWGWEGGFSVPIHGPAGYFALFTMAGPVRPMPVDLRALLQQLALLTHDRCRQLSGILSPPPEEKRLTVRELECLRWVATGKTDWEIGRILGVSATTVKTHVDQARRKLDARTRPQAVARMVLCGLS